MVNRAEELITQLEAEIVKRDARISNLERLLNNTSEIAQAVEQELAALKSRQTSGVVVGALASALEGIVHDERVPNEVSQYYAALLIEARRLNPCRAQAVPALMALREAITPEVIDWLKCGLSTNGRLIDGTHPALEKVRAVYAALQAKP